MSTTPRGPGISRTAPTVVAGAAITAPITPALARAPEVQTRSAVPGIQSAGLNQGRYTPYVPARLVCLRTPVRDQPCEMTDWTSPREAVRAWRALCDPFCGPFCSGEHMIVHPDPLGGLCVVDLSPPPPTLADELARCYPRGLADLYAPETWPLDPELNGPLAKPVTGSALAERIDRAHAEQVRRDIEADKLRKADYANVSH